MKYCAVSPSDRSVVTYFFEHPCGQRDHDKYSQSSRTSDGNRLTYQVIAADPSPIPTSGHSRAPGGGLTGNDVASVFART